MRYVSDDGKIFNTEHECLRYEQKIEQQKEKLRVEKQNKLDLINKKYEELQKLLSDFEKDYGVRHKPYFAPIYELMNMLCE